MSRIQFLGYCAGALLTNITLQSGYSIIKPPAKRTEEARLSISAVSFFWPFILPGAALYAAVMIPHKVISDLDKKTLDDLKKFGGDDPIR
jgi:hypothetical protein